MERKTWTFFKCLRGRSARKGGFDNGNFFSACSTNAPRSQNIRSPDIVLFITPQNQKLMKPEKFPAIREDEMNLRSCSVVTATLQQSEPQWQCAPIARLSHSPKPEPQQPLLSISTHSNVARVGNETKKRQELLHISR